MAADIVQGLTGSPEGIDKLKGQMGALLTSLFRLVPDSSDSSQPALTSLVNLSQDPAVARALLQLNVVARVMDYIREKTCPHTRLLVGTADMQRDYAMTSHLLRCSTFTT